MVSIGELYFASGLYRYPRGVMITYPDWWLSDGPSNTELLLRLNVEADTRAVMELKRDAVSRLIRE